MALCWDGSDGRRAVVARGIVLVAENISHSLFQRLMLARQGCGISLRLLLRHQQPRVVCTQPPPGLELRHQISCNPKGVGLGGGIRRRPRVAVLQALVFFQLLLDLRLRVAAGAHQVFLGVVQPILQQGRARLRQLQLLLNRLIIRVARRGAECR